MRRIPRVSRNTCSTALRWLILHSCSSDEGYRDEAKHRSIVPSFPEYEPTVRIRIPEPSRATPHVLYEWLLSTRFTAGEKLARNLFLLPRYTRSRHRSDSRTQPEGVHLHSGVAESHSFMCNARRRGLAESQFGPAWKIQPLIHHSVAMAKKGEEKKKIIYKIKDRTSKRPDLSPPLTRPLSRD